MNTARLVRHTRRALAACTLLAAGWVNASPVIDNFTLNQFLVIPGFPNSEVGPSTSVLGGYRASTLTLTSGDNTSFVVTGGNASLTVNDFTGPIYGDTSVTMVYDGGPGSPVAGLGGVNLPAFMAYSVGIGLRFSNVTSFGGVPITLILTAILEDTGSISNTSVKTHTLPNGPGPWDLGFFWSEFPTVNLSSIRRITLTVRLINTTQFANINFTQFAVVPLAPTGALMGLGWLALMGFRARKAA